MCVFTWVILLFMSCILWNKSNRNRLNLNQSAYCCFGLIIELCWFYQHYVIVYVIWFPSQRIFGKKFPKRNHSRYKSQRSTRCQFHQHFTSSFLYKTVLNSILMLAAWDSNFLEKRKSAQKMLVNYDEIDYWC